MGIGVSSRNFIRRRAARQSW